MTGLTDQPVNIRARWMPGVEARAGKFSGPSLIPALNLIQSRLGWLPREDLEQLSRDARRPLYEIQGLISFYPHFRTEPPAKITLNVCHDLSCFLREGEAHIAQLRGRYQDDDDVEVVEVSCLGRCDVAPAAAVNERPGPVAEVQQLVEDARAGDVGEAGAKPAQSRGPTTPMQQDPVLPSATRRCGHCSPGICTPTT